MFTSRDDLIAFMGRSKYDSIGDHDGDGVAGDEDQDQHADPAIAEANKMCESILYGKGFTHLQMELVSRDPVMRRAASKVAAEALVTQKLELVRDDGTTLYTKPAQDALKLFKGFAMAELRTGAERVAGEPSVIRARRNEVTPNFYVAPSRGNPRGPGGF